MFSDKKTSEPIKAHEVPRKCWETVAVDLFGPMPPSKHIVVVQDLASRFPAAKLVASTKASHVLPAMAVIYNSYGNPEHQLSDNGPPFNSEAMEAFAEKRDIHLKKIPPLHPLANPVETFMKPLGKTMKIAHYNRSSEKEALNHLLMNYRDTPHPATGIPPATMLFREGSKSAFPRRSVPPEQVEEARGKDKAMKQDRQDQVNASKYKIPSEFQIGDAVMLRNYTKSSKFDPVFLPQHCEIECSDDGQCLTIERKRDGRIFKRHPDDVKCYYGPHDTVMERDVISDEAIKNGEWHRWF
ncbi:hypothetical protein LOTGIDRAFT_156980 [Paramuricea clavata]|uniref:Uncharacterized protein n=1 Tax=Paramuricea clavata TaxID=317549 RepID=A0A6S7G253_PARCT|nr:hypothetical protein LOTGIDRAFT_156980 [Paramuricea clavata]